jgi:hypothetical protein
VEPEPIQHQESAARQIELPEEPLPDNTESLELVFRMPTSGERIRRRFLKTDSLGDVYDFIDHLQNEGRCQFEGVNSYTSRYQIIQTMPRKLFLEKETSLESQGLYPRGAML